MSFICQFCIECGLNEENATFDDDDAMALNDADICCPHCHDCASPCEECGVKDTLHDKCLQCRIKEKK